MKNIVLTGFMASGKTTVGKILSKKLGYAFYDTDSLIEEKEKRKISDIFSCEGEEYFRSLENEISTEFGEVSDSVISTGGGFVLNSENIVNLRKSSIVFNLNVSPDIIAKRYIAARIDRPLMRNDDLDGILKRYDDRREFYKNCDVVIDIVEDISPDEICDIIIEKYKNLL